MWLGDNVPRMQKARISVHQGKMREFIGQFHVDITASNKNEVTDEIIMEKISDASGSGSRVVDKNGVRNFFNRIQKITQNEVTNEIQFRQRSPPHLLVLPKHQQAHLLIKPNKV